MTTNKADLLSQLDAAAHGHRCENADLLHKWGEEALQNALNSHLSELYPEITLPIAIDDLVRHHLSHYYLVETVVKNLFDKKLVKVFRVQALSDSKILHHQDGSRLILDNCAVLISSAHITKTTLDATTWEESFKSPLPKKLEGVEIKYTTLKRWKGFKAGMHSYALQVAGLIYLNSLDSGPAFWEMYKKYITPIKAEELATEKEKAKKFEVEMELTMEAVAGYNGWLKGLPDVR